MSAITVWPVEDEKRGRQRFEFAAFLLAILIYAGFGSPTPDYIGWAEVSAGALLVLGLWRFVLVSQSDAVLIGFGVLVTGCITGLLYHNDLALVVRDGTAFLFLMMPLWAFRFFEDRPERVRILAEVFAVLGLAFSLRAIGGEDTLAYFANSPAVLFAAVFLLFQRSLFFKILALVPIVAVAVTLQRASMMWICECLVLGMAYLIARNPAKGLGYILVLGFGCWVFGDFIIDVLHAGAEKTRLYGGNMRLQELVAVWREISESWASVLFGHGWGATYQSPAVADIRVNFTHSLPSHFLLKTGALGCVTAIAGLAYVGSLLVKNYERSALVLALTGPFLISSFLYGSYKSFDYGLLLLLIVVICRQPRIERSTEARYK